MQEYDRSSIARIADAQWHVREFSTWSTDIGAQVKSFNQQMHVQLQQTSSRKTQQGKKPFMTPELWQLRCRKLQAKRNVSQIHRSHNAGLLRVCLCGWRMAQAREVDSLAAHRQRTDCLLVHWYCRLQKIAHALRERLKAAKFEHVALCMKDIQDKASAAEILTTIKHCMGPTLTSGDRKHFHSFETAESLHVTPATVMKRGTEMWPSTKSTGAETSSTSPQTLMSLTCCPH